MAGDHKTADASEADIDKIMERIRAEVARRRGQTGASATAGGQERKAETSAMDASMIHALISSAETYADIARTPVMLKFHGLARKLAIFTAGKITYLSSFITNKQRNFNVTLIHALKTLADNLEKISNRTAELGSEDSKTQNTLKDIDDRLRSAESAVESINAEAQKSIDAIRAQMTASNAEQAEVKKAIEETRSLVTAANENQAEVKKAIEETREHITAATEAERAEIEESRTALMNAINEKNAKIEELENNLSYLRDTITMQERQISIFLEKAGKDLPGNFFAEKMQSIVKDHKHRFDELYVTFEDRFRGTRESIKENSRVYLPYIKEVNAGTDDAPILDIGCGRGEWLELLKESGLRAKGVDINSVFIDQCRQQKLEVDQIDAIRYLISLPDSSIGALTGLHIIEHLPFEVLMSMLDETVRVLKPGGIAIFETPNPENILVGSCSFYLDPTHNKPLPSAMMKFMAEARGLSRVEILNLHPVTQGEQLSCPDAGAGFNERFYGPQDYAVIGYRT